MKRDDFAELHENLCTAARELMMKKSADYASSDDTFENFRLFKVTTGLPTELGIWPRFLDKVKRLGKAIQGGEYEVSDETTLDTILDIINYAIIMYGVMNEAPSRPPADDPGKVYICADCREILTEVTNRIDGALCTWKQCPKCGHTTHSGRLKVEVRKDLRTFPPPVEHAFMTPRSGEETKA